MDSTWGETQSSKRIDIATQLPYSTGSIGSETSFYSKMKFKPNETPHRFNKIHEKTQSFQSDFQNGNPLHVLHYSTGSKTDMQFHETGSYRIPASHDKMPLIYTDNTPGVTSLDPREVQTRMPSFWIDIPSDSNKAHQSYQASYTNGISSFQADNPKEMYPDNTPGITSLDPRNSQSGMPSYGEGIRSDSYKTHQSHQASFTKVIFPQQTGNPRETYPDKASGLTSVHPRNTQRRMPPYGVGKRSDSNKAHQSRQAISTNEVSPLHAENAREMNPANTPGVKSLEAHTRMLPYGVDILSDSDNGSQPHKASSTYGIPSYHTDNPILSYPYQVVDTNEMHRYKTNSKIEATIAGVNRAENETLSYQEGIPLYQTDFQKADAETYDERKPSYQHKNANRRKSPHLLIISEQMSHNSSGTRACPRCHCLLATQQQPSCLLSSNLQKAHDRPSVIMVPLNKKVTSTY